MRTEFAAYSVRDQLLFAMHSASRVGLWFAFAGFFFGYALIDQVGPFIRWYLFIPLGLAGVQLMTGVFLSRSPRESFRHGTDESISRPARAGEARRNGGAP